MVSASRQPQPSRAAILGAMSRQHIHTRSLSRRHFVQGAGLAGLALLADCAWPQRPGQAPRVPRIGWLAVVPASASAGMAHNLDAFRQGLQELGYFEGKNLVIEYRDAAGDMR